MKIVGLMSGTSLDGIDAVLVDVMPRGAGYALTQRRFAMLPFEPALRERLEKALPPAKPSAEEIAALDVAVGDAFATAARYAAGGEGPDLVASHGLTLFHNGAAAQTMQIGNPYVIREHIGATVAFDFRRADCAAGGHGAPLVPYVDALLFADPSTPTIALNLGGIANMTVIPAGAKPAGVRAWDVGPGNMLLDEFVRRRTNGREQYDNDGEYAHRGKPAADAVAAFLEDGYFALAPPKSTGRERYGSHWLERHAALLAPLCFEDGCATLLNLTLEAILRDVARYGPPDGRLIVSGGGAHNKVMMAGLAARLHPKFNVMHSGAAGIDPDAKEALAFAVLGYELLRGRAAGLAAVTGARHDAVLGALAPHDLVALLAKMERELAENREGV